MHFNYTGIRHVCEVIAKYSVQQLFQYFTYFFFIYFCFCRARPNLHVGPDNSFWRDVCLMSLCLVHYRTCAFYSKILKTYGIELLNIFLGFTFMLPCIVIDFYLNNQPDALIILILFCYKNLHVSDSFSAQHQEFSTLHSALVSFMQVFDDRFQAESGWNCVPS